MNPSKRNISFLVAIVLALLWSVLGFASESPVDWFAYSYGSSAIVATALEGEVETLLMDGTFRFKYPHDFQIQYYTIQTPVSITGHADFLEVQIGRELQYGYDRFWLFSDFQDYIYKLAEFSRMPLKFSGTDLIAGRSAARYLSHDEPGLVLWLDDQNGLPLLIRQGKRTLLSVASYTFGSDSAEDFVLIDLDLFFAEHPAQITLSLNDEGWAPSRLEIQEPNAKIQISFSNWSFASDWVDSSVLKVAELRNLNESFLLEFAEKNWAAALTTSQKILNLAPQFWQAYLFQAFSYEGLDNYLGVVENYQQVLMRDPYNHLALNNLAYHYFLREVQIPQALEMAEKAVSLDRKAIYLDTLGYGYYLVGRYEEARELLVEALTDAPKEAQDEIAAHLELVLQALGQGE